MSKKKRLAKEPIGSGRRFRQTEARLAGAGARDPAALAAWIGRKKYGKDRFQALALAGKRREDPPPPPNPARRTKV